MDKEKTVEAARDETVIAAREHLAYYHPVLAMRATTPWIEAMTSFALSVTAEKDAEIERLRGELAQLRKEKADAIHKH